MYIYRLDLPGVSNRFDRTVRQLQNSGLITKSIGQSVSSWTKLRAIFACETFVYLVYLFRAIFRNAESSDGYKSIIVNISCFYIICMLRESFSLNTTVEITMPFQIYF